MMNKEDFKKIWKDSTKEEILNQYYYDYKYQRKLAEDIMKAIEYIDINYLDFTYVYSKNEDLKCIHLDNIKNILKGSDDDGRV